MGTVTTKNILSALVYYDSDTTVSGGNRWYDAFGPGVSKYITNFEYLSYDNTTTDPTEWYPNITEVGAGNSTAVTADIAGGALVIVTAANENDGWQMQLGNSNTGEWVSLNGYAHTYFAVRFRNNDVTQSDTLCGLCITDTDCLGGVTDGIYFRNVDGSTTLEFVIEKNSNESSTSVGTLADDVWVTCEFYHDNSNVYVYVDGTLQATIADTATNFPNDELLRATIEFLTGEAVAQTMYLDFVRLIHIRLSD